MRDHASLARGTTMPGRVYRRHTGRKARSRWAAVSQTMEHARSIALSGLAIAASIIVAGSIFWEMRNGSYIIDPLDVAAKPNSSLPDKDGVTAQLRDEIGLAWHDVLSHTAVKPIVQPTDEPVFNITGTSLSVRYVATLVRQLFGFPLVRISGLMIEGGNDTATDAKATPPRSSPSWVRLVLRTSASTSGPFFDESGSYQDVMRHAGTATLAQIDPFAAAGAMSQGDAADRRKALILVRSTLIQLRRSEYPPPFYRFAPLYSDIPRGILTEANILFQMDDYTKALDSFRSADLEYKRRNLWRRDWYAAHDGMATMRMRSGEYSEAKRENDLSLRANPNYDSALYHQVEIEDNISRRFFESFSDAPTCHVADDAFQNALSHYDSFIASHPDFKIAYTQLGIMRRLRLSWLRKKNSVMCDGSPVSDDVIVQETKLAQSALETALTVDSEDPQSSFQYANFLYDMQDEQFINSIQNVQSRLENINSAIDLYKKSLAMRPDDYVVLFRLGKAFRVKSELSAEQERSTLRRLATDELCRARDLVKGDRGVAGEIDVALHGLEACR